MRHAAEDTLRRVNEQLEERVRRRTALVRLLQDVAVIANSAMPMDAAFEATLERVCRATNPGSPVTSTSIGWGCRGLPRWHVDDRVAGSERELVGGRSFESGEGLVGRVIEAAAPSGRATCRWTSVSRRGEPRSASAPSLMFPILVGERVVGALEFFSGAIDEPGPRLLEVMQNIGTQLGA